MKKIYLIILTSFFVLGTLKTKAQFAGGDGSSSAPYQISTASQLNDVRNNLGAHYKLISDIDLSTWLNTNSPTEGWNPIGNSTNPFSGTFDGNGHVISNLWINLPTNNEVALFGALGGTNVVEIKKLGVIISPNGIIGNDYVGAIVARIAKTEPLSSVTLQQVFVQGNVTGTDNVGGIVGRSEGNLTLTNSYTGTGTVEAVSRSGGLVSSVTGTGTTNITKCYTNNIVKTSLTRNPPSNVLAGGIIASGGSGGTYTISNNVALNPKIITVDYTSAYGRIIGWYGSVTITLENYAYDEMQLVNDGTTAGTAADLGLTTGIAHKNGQNKGPSLITFALYDELGWDLTNIWQLGNKDYEYPVLKTISLDKQPGGSGMATGLSVEQINDTKIFYDKNAENIVIVSEQIVSTSIYNIYGQIMLTSNDSTINISSLPKGIYIVKTNNSSMKILK